jgi:hypothetical protein
MQLLQELHEDTSKHALPDPRGRFTRTTSLGSVELTIILQDGEWKPKVKKEGILPNTPHFGQAHGGARDCKSLGRASPRQESWHRRRSRCGCAREGDW